MSAVLTIAGREMRERWPWLGVSLAVGPLSLLWPYGIVDRETLAAVLLVAFSVLTLIATAVMGASVLAGDLVQGRLGFLLARPVSGWRIWGGKLLAALVLAGSSILALVPSVLLGPRAQILEAFGGLSGIPIFVSCVVIGVCVAQGAVIAFRARSGRLLLDLLLAAVAGYAGSQVLWTLAQSGGLDLYNSQDAIGLVFVGVAVALTAASAAPFVAGGVGVPRAHLSFSTTLWAVLLAVLTVGAGRAYWAGRPAATDIIRIVHASTDPQERWIGLFAQARGRAHERPFLFHSPRNSSASPAVVAPSPAGYDAVFAANGEVAAWLEPVLAVEMRVRVSLAYSDDRSRPTVRVVPVPVPLREAALALTPGGGRLTVVSGSSLWVYDVPSARLVTTLSLPRGLVLARAFFADDDRVLIYGHTSNVDPRVHIVEARLQEERTALTGHIDGGGRQILMNRERSTIVAVDFRSRTAALYDARTGALKARLSPEGTGWPAVVFIGGGRIAQLDAETARLRVFDADGNLKREMDLGPARAVALDADASQGRLYAGVQRTDDTTELVILDTETFAVLRTEKGLWPIRHADTLAATQGDSRLFRDGDLRIVRLDVKTGRREVVLGRKG